ncbi:hypothetical protein ACJJTC_008883 [Scirpophaga incertulas]
MPISSDAAGSDSGVRSSVIDRTCRTVAMYGQYSFSREKSLLELFIEEMVEQYHTTQIHYKDIALPRSVSARQQSSIPVCRASTPKPLQFIWTPPPWHSSSVMSRTALFLPPSAAFRRAGRLYIVLR